MAEETDKPTSYAFLPATHNVEEMERLDTISNALREFFGNRLSFAPLEDSKPSKVLELGSGSGAWAIHAAETFPDASVLAVDINPIPPRPLPANLSFQQVDLTQPFPFESGTFDIVHTRLVMMHLPDGASVLQRALALVKPGGYLVVEDPHDDGAAHMGPHTTVFFRSWLEILRARGADPSIGRRLESIISDAGLFSEVHARKVVLPIGGKSADAAENALGAAWRANMVRNTRDLPTRFAAQGITTEVAEGTLKELEDPACALTTEMYFVWAKRKEE